MSIKPDPSMLTAFYSRAAQAAALGFAFPSRGDQVEVMLEGWAGNSYRVIEVHDRHVTVFAPCNVPGCTDHDPYSTVPMTAVRPHMSA